jgi:hypothetical protein
MIKKFNEYLNESEGTLTQEQKNWLNINTDGTWRVNPSTGLVDVDGDFGCSGSQLKNLMGVRFGRVSGYFDCYNNQLTSLEGAPQEVGGSFSCYGNQLTSLEGAPQEVVRSFYCSYNQLTSLEGAPQEVGEDFNCYGNKLTSLKGAPQKVGRDLHCYGNQLTSLEGLPEGIRNEFLCWNNPVSDPTLKALYKRMKSGMSWEEAVEMQWDDMNEDDRALVAQYNPRLTPEEIREYQALARLKKRVI